MIEFKLLDQIKQDIWSYLASTDKKIVMYGTGNGADKILDVFENKNIRLHGIFASDSFARDRNFRGYKVKKYCDFCDELDDFIVVVSFATQRDEVLENIYRIAAERELYAPDVPVFGTGLFDLEYFKKYKEELYSVYKKLEDDISKSTFVSLIAFKLTGDINHLRKIEITETAERYLIRKLVKSENYIDIGAYIGDTVERYCEIFNKKGVMYAFEPDKKNYAKMLKRFEEKQIECNCFNFAAWDNNQILKFYSNSGRAGSADKSRATEKFFEVQAVRVDEYIDKSVGFIKIDAEGSDINAINGLSNTIKKSKPCLKVAAYHRNEDFFIIPQTVDKICNSYRLYMRHLKYVPGWDTDFIFEFIKD